MGAVGIIVNPWAGKDVRRLHAPVGHTPDSAKIGIVRRVAIGALEAGATRVYAAADMGRIAQRAIKGIDGAELVDGPGTGSALDTRRAATQLHDLGCSPIVVLGGDGTCRDAVMGAPDATLVPISTGTNNVFPRFIDGSSAGTAAGLVAAERVPSSVVRRAKRLVVTVNDADGTSHTDIALVDVAAIAAADAGARAVLKAGTITGVVAAIAHPTSTGLSSVAGRVHPLDRGDEGAVAVRVSTDGSASRHVRVPIVPGHFDLLGVDDITVLPDGGSVQFSGPCVLAYDGEREREVMRDAVATVRVERTGPPVVDVDAALLYAAHHQLFDVLAPHQSATHLAPTEATHGH